MLKGLQSDHKVNMETLFLILTGVALVSLCCDATFWELSSINATHGAHTHVIYNLLFSIAFSNIYIRIYLFFWRGGGNKVNFIKHIISFHFFTFPLTFFLAQYYYYRCALVNVVDHLISLFIVLSLPVSSRESLYTPDCTTMATPSPTHPRSRSSTRSQRYIVIKIL